MVTESNVISRYCSAYTSWQERAQRHKDPQNLAIGIESLGHAEICTMYQKFLFTKIFFFFFFPEELAMRKGRPEIFYRVSISSLVQTCGMKKFWGVRESCANIDINHIIIPVFT